MELCNNTYAIHKFRRTIDTLYSFFSFVLLGTGAGSWEEEEISFFFLILKVNRKNKNDQETKESIKKYHTLYNISYWYCIVLIQYSTTWKEGSVDKTLYTNSLSHTHTHTHTHTHNK